MLREQLDGLPLSPGVYLFRDERDELLYVGKAKVAPLPRAQLLQPRGRRAPGIDQLVERIERIEVIVTQSEAEALHLEQNLVKRHRPPFNVRLRDDKSFPYIAVTVSDEYPRVMFTRERHRRGTVYFGPYANAKKVRETLDVLNRVFQFRPCEGPKPGSALGDPVSRLPHRAVHGAVHRRDLAGGLRRGDRGGDRFLVGRDADDRRDARAADGAAAAEERFEDAARYRNRL